MKLYSYYEKGATQLEYNSMSGKYVEFFENGAIWEKGSWNTKHLVGQHISYYENENLRHELHYNNEGLKEGLQKYYHSNGKLSMKGHWVNGKVNGTLVRYDKEGNITSVINYDAGKIIKRIYPTN